MINPPPPYPPSGRAYEQSLTARILLTIAAVWLFLTGGCTLMMGGSYALEGFPTYGPSFLIVFAVFGFVCMLPGLICLTIGLVIAGRARRRGDRD